MRISTVDRIHTDGDVHVGLQEAEEEVLVKMMEESVGITSSVVRRSYAPLTTRGTSPEECHKLLPSVLLSIAEVAVLSSDERLGSQVQQIPRLVKAPEIRAIVGVEWGILWDCSMRILLCRPLFIFAACWRIDFPGSPRASSLTSRRDALSTLLALRIAIIHI